MPESPVSRRHFLATSFAAGAAASAASAIPAAPALAHEAATFALPEDFLPVDLAMKTELPPGEIHVDPASFRLYWTLPEGRARRYTVGVGRAGLYHAGTFTMQAKREWPSWTPTRAMIARNPDYARWKDGMPGGIDNPLGARALYLFDDNGRDTYLRIHGTNAPRTIATAVSNGCARLINEHIIDLYDRVPLGTRVVLHPKGNAPVLIDETMA